MKGSVLRTDIPSIEIKHLKDVLWEVDYKLTPEWTLNGRINYTGSTYLNYTNNAKVPSRYRLEIGATYIKQLTNGHNLNWQMNVYNVLNRKYWIGRNSDTVYLDGGRNIVVSASYSF